MGITNTNVYRDQASKINEYGEPGSQNIIFYHSMVIVIKLGSIYLCIKAAPDLFADFYQTVLSFSQCLEIGLAQNRTSVSIAE